MVNDTCMMNDMVNDMVELYGNAGLLIVNEIVDTG